MKNRAVTYHLLLFLCLSIYGAAQNLLINEILSKNETGLMDEDGDLSDWIELYNPSDLPINLENWRISDQPSDRDKWIFPDRIIPAHGYLLLFASDKNRFTDELHLNFKIKSAGEAIYLSNPLGELMNRFPAVDIPEDISYGRKIDGSTNLFYFATPSPGATNDENLIEIIPTETLSFSHEAGWYEEAFSLEITASPGQEIRFTTDGSEPSTNDKIFDNHILLESPNPTTSTIAHIPNSPVYWDLPQGPIFQFTTIRVASFFNGFRTSPFYSKSYMIHPQKNKRYPVPVLSLITAPDDFFDLEKGIQVFGNGDKSNPQAANYYQSGREWERPVHLEYFSTDGQLTFSQSAGIRIHGFFSRQLPQKSMRLYARNDYGSSYFNYPFFTQKNQIDRYKQLIIRSVNPNYFHVPFKDELCHLLVKEMGLTYQAFEPVVVFINGVYWGVYNLKERHDEFFLAENFGLDENNINLLEKEGEVIAGNGEDFESLKSFVEHSDLSIVENYNQVKDWMDIDQFIEFLIAEMYFELWDFPEQNLKYWTTEDRTFQWLFNDGDSSMHEYWKSKLLTLLFSENTDVDGLFFTTLVNKLLAQPLFKKQFYSQFIHHLRGTLAAENVVTKIDSLQAIYDPMMPEHIRRWGYPNTMNDYHAAVDHLREFGVLRPPVLLRDLKNIFGIPFSIYPNAVGDELFVSYENEGSDEAVFYALYNLAGQEFRNGILSEEPIDVSDLPVGVYVLSLKVEGIWYAEKVLKE